MEECVYCHKLVPEAYRLVDDEPVCPSCFLKHHRHNSESGRHADLQLDPRVQSARDQGYEACGKHNLPATAYDSETFQPLCEKCISSGRRKPLSPSAAFQKAAKMLRTHRDKAVKLLSRYERETESILERKADACEHLLKVATLVKDAVDHFYNDQLTTINELCDQALKEIRDNIETIKYTILQSEELRQTLTRKKHSSLLQSASKLLSFDIPSSLSTFSIFTQDNAQQLVDLVPEVFAADLAKIDIPLTQNVLYHLSPVEPVVVTFDLSTATYSQIPACGVEEWPVGAKHVMVSEGVMLIAGGKREGKQMTECYLFSFADQTIRPCNDMRKAREEFALVYHAAFAYALSGTFNEKYDLERDEWMEIASMDVDVGPWAVKWVDKFYCTSRKSQLLFIYTPKTNSWMSMELPLKDFTPVYASFLNSETLFVLSHKCRSFLLVSGDKASRKDTDLNIDVIVDCPLLFQGSLYVMSVDRDGACLVSALNLKTLSTSVFT